MAIAHSKNDLGIRHDLVSHLKEVARVARDFAAKFGTGNLAYRAGLWRDLGKLDSRKKARYALGVPAARYNSPASWIYVRTQVLRP
jgi:CRISPR-associated endonuclease/helicase Cas3